MSFKTVQCQTQYTVRWCRWKLYCARHNTLSDGDVRIYFLTVSCVVENCTVSDTIHCPMVTSESVLWQCLVSLRTVQFQTQYTVRWQRQSLFHDSVLCRWKLYSSRHNTLSDGDVRAWCWIGACSNTPLHPHLLPPPPHSHTKPLPTPRPPPHTESMNARLEVY